jgi:hypothetical protein
MKTYKIIIYDPMLQVKSRVKISVNMKIDDVTNAIKKLFSQPSESKQPSESGGSI